MPEHKFVEATNYDEKENQFANWGKFMLLRFTREEFDYKSALPEMAGGGLLRSIGMDPRMIWVMDLQTLEGAMFRTSGSASYDLTKHRIWVCPMFEPFLKYLYALKDPWECPALVKLSPQIETQLAGYRRDGPT